MSHTIELVVTQEAMCQKSFKLRVVSSKVFISVAFVFCCSLPLGHHAVLVQAVTFMEHLYLSQLSPHWISITMLAPPLSAILNRS
jgi:hypothetical protein